MTSDPAVATVRPSAASLRRLLEPKSVAVVGATADPGKFGSRPPQLLRLYGYAGAVHLVNPRQSEIEGQPCYPFIGAIDPAPDVAVVSVPAPLVPSVAAECRAAGVGAVIVYSGGFAERGADGADLQAKLVEAVAGSETIVVGPNCQGVANFHMGAILNFSTTLMKGPAEPPGGVAILGQSGSMGAITYHLLREQGVGVGYLASTGNEAVLSAIDLAHHLIVTDDKTRVVLLLLEGVRSGKVLIEAAEAARASGKSLCVLKAGRSPAGRLAVRSHAASMPVDQAVFDAVCGRHGLAAARDVRELVDIATGLAAGTPEPRGRRIAIFSNSGGMGALMTDIASAEGLEVAVLSEHTVAALAPLMPAFIAPRNPVDLANLALNATSTFEKVLDTVAADPSVDQLHVSLAFQIWAPEETLELLRRTPSRTGKPLFVTWIGGTPDTPGRLIEAGVPTFDDPRRGIRLARALADHAARTTDAADVVGAESARLGKGSPGRTNLWKARWNAEHSRFFDRKGIPTVPTAFPTTAGEACDLADRLGYPIVLKLASTTLTHKSDIGAVRLALRTRAEVSVAFEDLFGMRAAEGDGVLLQPMVTGAVAEIFTAVKRDPDFGPIILVGSGGVHVESFDDVQVLLPPLTADTVRAALARTRLEAVLVGARGTREGDVDAAVASIVALARAIPNFPASLEVLEINPLMVRERGKGALVVDWRCDSF